MYRLTILAAAAIVAACTASPAAPSVPSAPTGVPPTSSPSAERPDPSGGPPSPVPRTGLLDPSVLPSAGYLAFAVKTESGDEVRIVHPDGSSMEIRGTGREPAWLPDGRSLLYTAPAENSTDTYPVVGNVFRVPVGGGAAALVVANARGAAVSPDGVWLTFNRGVIDTGDAYVTRLDGSMQPRRIDEATAPAWSPDGAWLLMVSGSKMQLVAAALDGLAVRPVPGGMDASWTLDGRIISVWYTDSFNLTVSTLGGGATTLLTSPIELTSPAMLPGGAVVYLAGGDVWRFEPATASVRLTSGLSITGALAVSPDGKWLAAAAQQPEPALVLVSVDGGYAPIVRGVAVSGLAWQPMATN